MPVLLFYDILEMDLSITILKQNKLSPVIIRWPCHTYVRAKLQMP